MPLLDPGMTHRPFDGSNQTGAINASIWQYLQDVASGKVAERGDLKELGDALRSGDYGKAGEYMFPGGGFATVGKKLGGGLFGRVGDFDPRYSNPVGGSNPRIKDIDRMRDLSFKIEGEGVVPESVSLADLEGRPFITSMSDRTRAGGNLTQIKGRDLNRPVGLLGGQDYMFNNPGQVWASAETPVKSIMDFAAGMKKQTGYDPLYMPWRMAPTGGDFAHMTGETMLSYADVGMSLKNKSKANTAIKKIIPGWKGIGAPAGLDQYRSISDKQRKAVKDVLDKRFRDTGGLSVGEARLAVSDPSQLTAREGGLMNVGEIFSGNPMVMESGHVSYPRGVPGQGIGRLKEDVTAYQLLPGLAQARGVTDPMRPRSTDIRAMQMKPYAGIITPDLLKSLGL